MSLNINIKQLKFSLLILIILSLISQKSFSQIFDSEQSPLSVKWREIKSGGFTIIYPSELEKEAQRMANTFIKIYPSIGQSLNIKKSTIPIILQNRGTTANGFVQLAPKKSQFYTTPPQQFDSQDWLNNLAVHELRHVAQFQKITGGKSHPFSEEIYFAYLGAAIPTWFYEGDAVSIETSLTNAGRGRQPSWIMPFRTSVLSGKNFSYSKAYFGSEKDVDLGYYQLGYLVVSKLRADYGKNISDRILSDIRQRPLRLYPFSQTLKKITGKNTKKYFQQTMPNLKEAWQKQAALTASEEYMSLNMASKVATSYYLPTEIAPGKVLALKHTKTESPGFIFINEDKSEERLFKIAYQEQPWLSYANNNLIWDEIRYDPRYKQRSYSVICSYNFLTKIKKQLTFKSRLFSPSLSGDGKKIVAVKIDLNNKANLVILDAETGKIIEEIKNLENLILQTPSLNIDGTKIIYISVSEKGKALWLHENGKNTKIVSETNQQLSRPVFINNEIAFNAHINGVDNIYSVDVDTKKTTSLTSAKYGAFNPSLSIDSKSILFNNYQLLGYEIAKTKIQHKEIEKNNFVLFGEEAQKQENQGNVFDQIPDSTYSSKKYSPLAHSINFHSLSPTIDGDNRVGLQLKSNDLLNTVDFFTGITYDSDLQKLEYNVDLKYKSLYPILIASFKNRPRTAFYEFAKTINKANWRENYLTIKASLPLSINVNHHNYGFLGEVGTSITQRNFEPQEKLLFRETIKFPMNYKVGISHSIRTAEREVAPKWGQTLSFSYFNQPFEKNLKGNLVAFGSSFYFPGIAKNHSLMASFNFQETSGTLNFNNEIATVYGYSRIIAKSELNNTLLFNYRFPIAYPDSEIGPIAYVRNIRGGVFSHYENIGSETNLTQPKTFGIELRSSINLLRYQPVVDLGARVIFVNKIYKQNPILEFIFNYNF